MWLACGRVLPSTRAAVRAGVVTYMCVRSRVCACRYTDDFTLRDLLKKYSEFISFPIELWTEKTEYDQVGRAGRLWET
eukprot:3696124-Pleurochrysis_carterae.AAC.1